MATDKQSQFPKRYCVSFSQDQADALEDLARRNAVSVSWLVRLAVDDFIRERGDQQLRLKFGPTERG
jgi:predicted transcriptional regulator